MNLENRQIIIIAVVILIGAVLLYRSNRMEGYDSSTLRGSSMQGQMDDYYLWRAYGHNVHNKCRLKKYPYNQQPLPHPERINKYKPYFYDYGYGQL